MAFCANCGTKMDDGVKFCPSCGTPARGASPASPKPAAEKVGSIRKCPACGADVPSMTAVCPDCGHEFSGVNVSSSITAFFNKLQAMSDKSLGIPFLGNDKKRIALIESFPIPNSREDILEFIIMASSQYKPLDVGFTLGTAYLRFVTLGIWPGPVINKYNKAWEIKISQAYTKGKIAFTGDSKSLAQIETIMQKINTSQKRRKLSLRIAVISIVLVMALSVALPIILLDGFEKETNKEVTRLEALQTEIMADIKDGNLTEAQLKLSELKLMGYEHSGEEKAIWDERRTILLRQIEELQRR
jgi:RNA polymerase subunit RPABC4/transcription elongation factor Spt4